MAKTETKPESKPTRTFRMKDTVYKSLERQAKAENRKIGNQLEELILRGEKKSKD